MKKKLIIILGIVITLITCIVLFYNFVYKRYFSQSMIVRVMEINENNIVTAKIEDNLNQDRLVKFKLTNRTDIQIYNKTINIDELNPFFPNLVIEIIYCGQIKLPQYTLLLDVSKVEFGIENASIVAFLEPDITDDDIEMIRTILSSIDGIESIKFISKEESYQNMLEELGDSVLSNVLDSSVLLDSFQINVTNRDDVERIAKVIKSIDKIQSVSY